MEMMEAVALFDYIGRTDKELSFKKNQIIYIYKQINHEWWLGHTAGGNQSGFVPDGYIRLKSRRRDSAPVQHLPPLSLTPDPSSSLHSINFTTSSNDQLDAPISTSLTAIVCRPSSDFSLVDEHRLDLAKETEILEVDSDIDDNQVESTYANLKPSNHPMPTYRTIYDVSPSSPPLPISTSSSSSHLTTTTNEQQIIDIDSALREVLSGIRTVEECHAQCFRSIPLTNTQQETGAPDLVLNLPISTGLITPPSSKSLDDNYEHQSSKSSSPIHHLTLSHNNTLSLIQSTITTDSTRTSRSNSLSIFETIRPSPEPIQRKKIPPPIMKKPEKTLELIKRLGLQPTTELSYGAPNSSSSTSSSSSSTNFNVIQQQQQQQPISIATSSKSTAV